MDQSRTIGNLKFQTNTSRSVLDGGSSSSAILTLDTPSSTSRLIDNTSSKAITIYPSINFTASGVIYNRNKTGNQLIFTGGTIYINSNTITTDSRSTHATNQYITFDGPVVGDGIINVDDSQAAGATQGISLGADADFSTFTGTINAKNNPIVSSTTNAFGSALTLDGTASFEINVASTFTGSISRLATTAGAATVTFNANQSMGALTVDTQNLAIDFAAAATTVEFSEYTTSTSEGVVDLQNYVSGSLKIGSTGTSVDSAILDTWTLDGATAAITQDTDGSIIFAGCSTPDDITTLAATAGAEYVSLSWDDPTCFDEVLVVAKEASAVTVTPTGDGSAYTADADFDSGTDLGTSEYAVFKGASNTVDVTGLTKGGTTYHFTVFTRKGTTWNTGVTISATTNNMYTSTSGANGTGLNWEDASSWIAGVIPSATSDDVTINTGIVINSDVDVNNIVIDARVTVKEGFSLTANDLQQNSQLIVGSISDAFASVIATTLSGTGTLIYNRWLNDSPNNDLISSPVSGVPFSSVAEASTNESRFFINPSVTLPTTFLDLSIMLAGEFETYSTPTDDAVVIGTGQGYRAATIAGAANTVRFVGNIEVGNVDIDITDGGDATYGQWNLIGNPYPSYLDFDTFFTANTGQFEAGLNNAIYAWNGTLLYLYCFEHFIWCKNSARSRFLCKNDSFNNRYCNIYTSNESYWK